MINFYLLQDELTYTSLEVQCSFHVIQKFHIEKYTDSENN